jgi:hypothetical protein
MPVDTVDGVSFEVPFDFDCFRTIDSTAPGILILPITTPLEDHMLISSQYPLYTLHTLPLVSHLMPSVSAIAVC